MTQVAEDDGGELVGSRLLRNQTTPRFFQPGAIEHWQPRNRILIRTMLTPHTLISEQRHLNVAQHMKEDACPSFHSARSDRTLASTLHVLIGA